MDQMKSDNPVKTNNSSTSVEYVPSKECIQSDVSLVRKRTEKTTFDKISLDVVSFNRSFCRNRGTLAQMIKSLADMRDRLDTPINDYQKGLYPHIQTECASLVKEYEDLLSNVVSSDYYVFGYYLNGPNNDGKRKATTTPHEMKSYGVSEFKETLRSINDRLRHIKLTCQKKIKESTRIDNDVFGRMITFCDTYHVNIDEKLKSWNEFINNFRKDKGVVMKPSTHEENDSQKKLQKQVRVQHKQYDNRTKNAKPVVKVSNRVTLRSIANESSKMPKA